MTARDQLRTMLSARAAKAYTAGAVAALASLAPVAGDGVQLDELLTAAGLAVAAFQATYWIRNAREPQDESTGDTSPPS